VEVDENGEEVVDHRRVTWSWNSIKCRKVIGSSEEGFLCVLLWSGEKNFSQASLFMKEGKGDW